MTELGAKQMARGGATHWHSLPTGSFASFHPDLLNRKPKGPPPPPGPPTHSVGKGGREGGKAQFSTVGHPYLTLKETWRTLRLCRASEPVTDPSSREL